MANHLTIDQILAEVGTDNLFEGKQEKTASAGPSESSSYSDSDITEMVSFLKEASVPNGGSESIKEKLASALLLSQSLQSLVTGEDSQEKTASENKPQELTEAQEAFTKEAKNQGYSDEEIQEFLEKQSSLRRVGQGLAAATALATAGVGGHQIGKTKERKRAQKAFQETMPKVHRHGMLMGKQRGMQVGAQKMDSAWRNKLQHMKSQKG